MSLYGKMITGLEVQGPAVNIVIGHIENGWGNSRRRFNPFFEVRQQIILYGGLDRWAIVGHNVIPEERLEGMEVKMGKQVGNGKS
jgi:hypothetical protein